MRRAALTVARRSASQAGATTLSAATTKPASAAAVAHNTPTLRRSAPPRREPGRRTRFRPRAAPTARPASCPTGADQQGLDSGQPEDLRGARAPHSGQGLLPAATRSARPRHRDGHQGGQHGAGQAEEEEQHLGVGGVAAGGVEGGPQVVARPAVPADRASRLRALPVSWT